MIDSLRPGTMNTVQALLSGIAPAATRLLAPARLAVLQLRAGAARSIRRLARHRYRAALWQTARVRTSLQDLFSVSRS